MRPAGTEPRDGAVMEVARPRDAEIRAIAHAVARHYPPSRRHPARALDAVIMRRLERHPELRSGLFRLVDVAPACTGYDDVAEHLSTLTRDVDEPPAIIGVARLLSRTRAGRQLVGRAASLGVRGMSSRFIVGVDAGRAAPTLGRLWTRGVASSVDLLGEATVTPSEADAYAELCQRTIEVLAASAARWPERPVLERDRIGPIPRVNLSVKVTALTPRCRRDAPAIAIADAAPRFRAILRTARDRGAHLHVDMESIESRDMVTELVCAVLSEDEFRRGPEAGIVQQAYLVDADENLESLLGWAAEVDRATPLTVRLVKGAYWDHEVVAAAQAGWAPPVYETKADSDRAFERMTIRLLESRPLVRVAIASHNLRSVAHAAAHNAALGGDPSSLEFQVLRGLGDDLQDALVESGFRVRTYCPVGDLNSGMAYLVRRLLENTSNDSFLANHARGADFDELLVAP